MTPGKTAVAEAYLDHFGDWREETFNGGSVRVKFGPPRDEAKASIAKLFSASDWALSVLIEDTARALRSAHKNYFGEEVGFILADPIFGAQQIFIKVEFK